MKKLATFIYIILMMSVTPVLADFLIVPVEKVIDGGLAEFIRRVVVEAEEGNVDGIIFQVDTPGGRVDSAVDIKDTIIDADVLTIAYVDKNAISAGSLISLACDSLYMSTGASIGAATAVDLQGKKAPEKMISYFRAQMRATAEANGRRADIAEAMVDDEIEIENITEAGKLLTLTYTEALDLGISDGTVESIDEILELIGSGGATIETVKPNWAENIVRFLTHPVVSSLLMSIGFIGLIVEIRTPGWGVGGTLALIALTLFFGSHYIVRLAGVGELLLFTAGIALLALEVFVIPGFGLAGLSGIAMIVISVYLSLIGRLPEAGDFLRASYTFGGAFLATILLTIILIRYLPRTAFYDKLMLDKVESAGDGYASAKVETDMVGARGTALSDLRPAGKAEIDGRRYDVVTEGGYIAKDSAIEVIDIHGARIVVKNV